MSNPSERVGMLFDLERIIGFGTWWVASAQKILPAHFNSTTIIAILFLLLGLVPFFSIYNWIYFLYSGRRPKRPRGMVFLAYLGINIICIFIGLRLLLR